jgi:hypothetical protein
MTAITTNLETSKSERDKCTNLKLD